MLLKMNTKTKIPIYYVDEENDMQMLVEQAVNSTFEENISRYFQVLAFNCALGGIDITNQPLSRKIYYIDDDPK
jgi:hypothetical protein